MADSFSNASPVGRTSGFPRPNSHELARRHNPAPSEDEDEARTQTPRDGVSLHCGAALARRLLRERVLSRTRERLELTTGEFLPKFAEDVDKEPVGAFLGRLIGAQNQLAALRVGKLPQPEIRSRLDLALREGIAEAMEMLARDGNDTTAGCEFVGEVLAEYGRRLAELVGD